MLPYLPFLPVPAQQSRLSTSVSPVKANSMSVTTLQLNQALTLLGPVCFLHGVSRGLRQLWSSLHFPGLPQQPPRFQGFLSCVALHQREFALSEVSDRAVGIQLDEEAYFYWMKRALTRRSCRINTK